MILYLCKILYLSGTKLNYNVPIKEMALLSKLCFCMLVEVFLMLPTIALQLLETHVFTFKWY